MAITVVLGDDPLEQDLVLVGGARVSGVVRADSDQRPLAEATVSLLDESGNVLATTCTGEKGEFAFEDLPAGDYTLIASGFGPVAAGLRIAPGDDVAHDMTLGGGR